jgi:thiamine biosynthesis lipoprotein
MSTGCHVALLGGTEADLDRAEAEVRDLEATWSRFVPASEVSRLNAADGGAVAVSARTRDLIRLGVEARYLTHGWFDPFLERQLSAHGYDRDFAEVCRTGAPTVATELQPLRAGCGEPMRTRAPVVIDDDRGTVRLLDGAGFDSGGYGKGLTADLVTAGLLGAGVEGVLVNLGGDIRVRGRTPPGGWRIRIEDPFTAGTDRHRPVATIAISDCGLCTSSPFKRRWRTADGAVAHHVIDPRTGRPGPVEVASVTVTATDAWSAEALTTAVLLAGPVFGAAFLRRAGADGLAVGLDGRVAAV